MADKELSPSQKIMVALGEYFDQVEVKFKPSSVKGNRALALSYIDARVVMDRLDEVVGPENWKDDYEIRQSGDVVCSLSVRMFNEWITKKDVGSLSAQPDDGDKLKAAFSDSLKRAAVKFGIGRFLYRMPQIWHDYDATKKQFVTKPPLPPWAKPGQPQMSGLKLEDEPEHVPEPPPAKTTVTTVTNAPKPEPAKGPVDPVITEEQAKTLKGLLTVVEADNATWGAILAKAGVDDPKTRLTMLPASKYSAILADVKARWATKMANADKTQTTLKAPGAA